MRSIAVIEKVHEDFDEVMLMQFRDFVQNEHEYVEKYPKISKQLQRNLSVLAVRVY